MFDPYRTLNGFFQDLFSHPSIGQEVSRKALEQKNLLAQRSVMIPGMLNGKSFLDEDNAKLYDGLSPKEINELAVGKFGSKGVSDDPFEGLSPEEIDAMFASTERN